MNTRDQHKFKSRQKDAITDFPANWEIEKISRIAKPGFKTFTDGDWIEAPFITDSGVRLLQTGNIGLGTFKEQGFRYISEESFNALRCTEVKPGDVLICRLADPVGRACLAPNLPEKMITSVDVCILKPSADWDSRFIVYFLSSKPYLDYLQSFSRGGTRDRVSRSFLGNVRIPRPSLSRQIEIADFLDRETAKADALVAKYERLIELLEEKRVALITQAVTKGLDFTVAMKGSGVEWIGDIPAHWTIMKLGLVASLQSGFAFPSDAFTDDGTPIVQMNNLKGGILDLEDAKRIPIRYERADMALRSGDLLIGMSGSLGDTGSVGNLARVSQRNLPCQLNQRVGRFSVNSEWISLDYLALILRSDMFRVPMSLRATGTAQFNISPSSIGNTMIALPPRDEQAAIVAQSEHANRRSANLMVAARKAIDLTREHRAALITAAVAGQIDVRTYKAKDLEEVVA